MTGPVQLGLDGRDVPVDELPHAGTAARFTKTQHAILEHVDREGHISTVAAGVIMHAHRHHPHGEAAGRLPGECIHAARYRLRRVVPRAAASDRFDWANETGRPRVACCPWAATDGSNALKRLVEGGHLRRESAGRYVRSG